MYSNDFLTAHVADRMAAARHYAWTESLRPSRRTRLARQLQRLAIRLQPDLASTTSASKRNNRKAY